jgi:ribose 5-phosphate isomerase A
MLIDEHVEALLETYLKNNSVVALGTGEYNLPFLKKIALFTQTHALDVKMVSTSHAMGLLCSDLGLKTISIDDAVIDTAFDFVDMVDEDFNYISNETSSLIRDKMIANEAGEMIVVCEKKNFVKRLSGPIRVEVSQYGLKKTMLTLMNLGEVKQPTFNTKPLQSEMGHAFLDVYVDSIFSLDDIDSQLKSIPGVLETSLFLGFADRAVLHNGQVVVKSRIQDN